MDTISTSIDLSRLNCEIVVLADPQAGVTASYRVICNDVETGKCVGSALLPADPDGGPPNVSLGDIVGLIGGYRVASIFVEIESERLARLNRRISEGRRRR